MKKLLVFFLLPCISLAQHTISGKFAPANDYSYIFLYRSTPVTTEFVSRSEVDSLGNFSIKLDSMVPAGIYKLVYAMPPEKNNFNILYDAEEDIDLSFSVENGLIFETSNENKLWASYTNSLDMVNSTISNYYNKGAEDKKAFKDIFKTLSDTQEAYESNSKDLMVHTMIKANRPYIPTEYEDVSQYAKNLKRDYLKHIDFTDELLQSSDLISDRVMTFVFGMSDDTSDDYYKGQLKKLWEYIEDVEPKQKLNIILPVFEQFSFRSNDPVATHMIDSYLMDLAEKTNDQSLIKNFEKIKSTAIGLASYDFAIEIEENGKMVKSSLHELNGYEKYILIFWSSTCGHCLEEMPKLKELVSDKDNIKVVAFGIEDSDENWQEEIKNYPEFFHVLGLNKWDNEVVEKYAINATPSYFVLDENKIIIAKPFDVHALKDLLKKQ